MPIPQTPRVVFRRNPLAEVVCQLRFPTILSITADPPAAFQAGVRDVYPIYQKAGNISGFPKEIADLISRFQMNIPGETLIHRFRTPDGEKTISLSESFIAISVSKYERWEGFQAEVQRAVSVLENVYRPVFYNRTGLRYQNVIDRESLSSEKLNWKDLINPLFSGVLAADSLKNEIEEARSEVLFRLKEVDKGHVKLSYGLASLPPPERPTQVYAFDADFYTQGRCSREQSFDALDEFHRLAGNLFRWAITPKLQQLLDPEPSE